VPPSSSINVTDLIDRHPIGALQIRIVFLCGIVALLDGFDLLATGLAAPAIADALHIAPSQISMVLSAALLGLMAGAFGLGPLGDHYGFRQTLIGAAAAFGAFTLCTSVASTFPELLLIRFLAGVGLGGPCRALSVWPRITRRGGTERR
jgi:MFS transporter, AAHS family, 4-hydroxybenzoate transporter